MDQRMSSLERHWAFFLGFGIPLTALTFFLSTLRAAAVYAIFFPSVSSVLYSIRVSTFPSPDINTFTQFVIMATTAVVQPSLSARPHSIPSGSSIGLKDFELPDRLPIFTGVRKLNDLFISLIRKFGGVRGDSLLLDKKKEAFGKLV